ncbi:uncharacterized protein ACA1_184480 [Acanthamoeba castellanii str. Neff]|uniref:Uncharacterized protein n=1 Tax=Acanthamoeba castellanii (strain ATCC 30010 / Neff) TaxID=1257118 RepID=L8HAQ7_ACACF|nr:uncharacterized protein ACA1_184480 [Acanthamoeba castellanii str. Neff]ELR21501.1 hypothetical protein ACA1_184480 [Acanthamoeba castellanii str. Neff]
MQSGFWWASASAFHFGGQMTYTSDLHFPLALGSVHAPQLMQATSGIKYKNCNNIWRFLTNPDLHTYKGGETDHDQFRMGQ